MAEETSIKKAPRLEWVDYAKGLAIILVVYRHALYGVKFSGLEVEQWLIEVNENIVSFRMPLFFVLSGLFAGKSIIKRNSIQLFARYKFNTILYPYLIWGIIQISLQIFLSNYTNSSRTTFDFLLLLIQPRAIDHLWYLYALFNVSILFFFLFSSAKMNTTWMLIVSLVLYGISSLDFIQEYSLIKDAIFFLLFFVIGHMIRDYVLSDTYSSFLHSFKPFFIIFPMFCVSQYYLFINRGMNPYLFAIVALIGAFFIFSLAFALSKYKFLKVFRRIGSYSLQVYLMHVLIISATRIVLMKFFGITSTHIILIIAWLLGTSIPVLLYGQFKNTWFRYLFSLRNSDK